MIQLEEKDFHRLGTALVGFKRAIDSKLLEIHHRDDIYPARDMSVVLNYDNIPLELKDLYDCAGLSVFKNQGSPSRTRENNPSPAQTPQLLPPMSYQETKEYHHGKQIKQTPFNDISHPDSPVSRGEKLTRVAPLPDEDHDIRSVD